MIALITGATSGIGKSTAIEFAKHGYDLIITSMNEDSIIKALNQLKKEAVIHILEGKSILLTDAFYDRIKKIPC